ncbi:hypothetical protein FF36_00301 [Frankia torreyi]|uniref:Uncharacterized protein n=1 Tax=Frankia torreyi TaxID=1856 RepID=A0A0D8BLN5_9ACTN|nr:hypothetical protein FF36_00301 [Frankia torreyi]KQM08016.1 hypothetical protein FF86_1001272 [Frankia sp. CpI1-P]
MTGDDQRTVHADSDLVGSRVRLAGTTTAMFTACDNRHVPEARTLP